MVTDFRWRSAAIEKGRYASPKIPVENRLCTSCDLGEIEDEYHFMMKCKLYDDLREELLLNNYF
jgi:hypothetical protein